MTLNRIISDPAILNGQACIPGTRLSISRVLKLISLYPNREQLKEEFPELDDDAIRQSLEFAPLQLDDRMLDLRDAL